MHWETVGHLSAKRILEHQLENSRFSHAYLFTGPEGVGKLQLALEFARHVRNSGSRHDPDIEQLDIDSSFGVEDMRSFLARSSLTPMSGDKKFAIINNAQALNLQSSNALLKTLEEPSPSTILILVAHNRSLPTTILSRVQTLDFNRLPDSALIDLATTLGISASPELLAQSGGLPARFSRLLTDTDFAQQVAADAELLRTLSRTSFTQRLASVQPLAERENPDLSALCLNWLIYSRQQLPKAPTAALFSWLRELEVALSYLSNSALNKKFVVQRLVRAVPENL